MARVKLGQDNHASNDAGPPTDQLGQLRECAATAARMETAVADVRSTLAAIQLGDLLAVLPAGSADAERHNAAVALLDLARRRLDHPDGHGPLGEGIGVELARLVASAAAAPAANRPSPGGSDANSAASVDEGERLYAAWRVARARWELARWDRPDLEDDLACSIDEPLCAADHRALMAYLLHPVDSPAELARKLRTMSEEDAEGLTAIHQIRPVVRGDMRRFHPRAA